MSSWLTQFIHSNLLKGIVLDRKLGIVNSSLDLTGEDTILSTWPDECQDFLVVVQAARQLYFAKVLNPSEFVAVLVRRAQVFFNNYELCIDCRYAPCTTLTFQPAPTIELGYHRWSNSVLYIPKAENE